MESAPLRAAHESHLQTLRRRGRAPATLKCYRLYVRTYLDFLEQRGIPATLDALTYDLVGDCQDWLRERARFGSRDGASAELQLVRVLKALSVWLWRRGFLLHDPLARLQRPTLPRLHRVPFTESEATRLLTAARLGPDPVRDRALLLLGLDTGARIGELVGVQIDHLHLDRRAVIFWRTKNGHPRPVVYGVQRADGGPCHQAIEAWLAVRDAEPGVTALFTNRGIAMSTQQARRIWKRLGQSAGVRDAFPHRGRHTHATELLAELPGAELHLRRRLGHLSKDVLADYVTISDRAAQRIADVASLSLKWNLGLVAACTIAAQVV